MPPTPRDSRRRDGRDGQRAAVYAAEEQWARALDRGGLVDFHGSRLHLPVQLRFGSLADAGRYADAVVAAWSLPPVRVRTRAGDTKAHYEAPTATSGAVIALPGAPWAMRETVLLHELAHHVVAHGVAMQGVVAHATDEPTTDEPDVTDVCDGPAAHGPQFAAVLVALADDRLGSEAALLLRTGYAAAGVDVAVSATVSPTTQDSRV